MGGLLVNGGTTLTRKSNMPENIPPKIEYSVAGDLIYRCLHFQIQCTRKHIYSKSNSMYSNSYADYDVCALALHGFITYHDHLVPQ